MITVKRRLLSEVQVKGALDALANRYHLPNDCYDESDADQMSDFDAQKWLSLCDQLKSVRRRNPRVVNDCAIPYSLRSIYGTKAPSKELENSSDTLIELAA
ncbi:MAG: hypothetical protein ABSE46_20130 [Terracidiphilus sp.]